MVFFPSLLSGFYLALVIIRNVQIEIAIHVNVCKSQGSAPLTASGAEIALLVRLKPAPAIVQVQGNAVVQRGNKQVEVAVVIDIRKHNPG